jgi:hypothetical protein
MPSKPDEIKFSVAYTWNEVFRYHVRTQRKVLLAPFLASAVTYIFTRSAFCAGEGQPLLSIEGAAPWIVMVTVFTIIGYIRPWLQVVEEKQKGEYRGRERLYLLSSDGVSVETENLRSFVSWRLISRAQETKNGFYLYLKTDLLRFHFIPKRCISTDADLVSFRSLLRESLGSRAALRH